MCVFKAIQVTIASRIFACIFRPKDIRFHERIVGNPSDHLEPPYCMYIRSKGSRVGERIECNPIYHIEPPNCMYIRSKGIRFRERM